MKEDDYNNIKNWFVKYTDSFLEFPEADIENLLLKKEHTLRVCKEMEIISKDLSPKDKILSLTAALLHDIGRFDQLRIYKTFSDSKSEDHASLGVRILKERNVLKNLDPLEVELIYFAVENHNKPEIMPGCSFQTKTITKLLRDADKLDIWRVVIDYYKDGREYDNPSLVHNLPVGTDVGLSVFQATQNREIIPYHLLQTIIDIKILQMGWIYHLNTKKALELAIERSYLEKIFNTLPKTKMITQIYNTMSNFLTEKTVGICKE